MAHHPNWYALERKERKKKRKQGTGSFFPDELTVLGRRRGAAGKQGEGGRVLWGGGEAFRRRTDGGGGLGQRWQRRPRRPRGGVDGDSGSGHPEIRRGWLRVPGGFNWWRG